MPPGHGGIEPRAHVQLDALEEWRCLLLVMLHLDSPGIFIPSRHAGEMNGAVHSSQGDFSA